MQTYARRVKLIVRTLALVALVVVSLVVAPTAAFAHDELTSSSPANGAALTSPPKAITLVFEDAPLAGTAKMAAKASDGSMITLPDATITGASVSVAWPSTAPSGTYEVAWRNVGQDGHPLTGTLKFSYTGGPSPTASPTVSPTVVTPSPSVTPKPTSSGTALIPWLIGGFVGVLLIIILAVLMSNRRRSGPKP